MKRRRQPSYGAGTLERKDTVARSLGLFLPHISWTGCYNRAMPRHKWAQSGKSQERCLLSRQRIRNRHFSNTENFLTISAVHQPNNRTEKKIRDPAQFLKAERDAGFPAKPGLREAHWSTLRSNVGEVVGSEDFHLLLAVRSPPRHGVGADCMGILAF